MNQFYGLFCIILLSAEASSNEISVFQRTKARADTSTALMDVKVVDLCFTDYKDIDDRYYQYQIRATFHTQFEY